MDALAELKAGFQPILEKSLTTPAVSSILNQTMSVPEYRAIMREVFHHTRENPQLQALATVYFRGHQRELVKDFFKHAASEIGHDELALCDFQSLGGDATPLPYENPLPATSGLLAYGFYQIYNLNTLGYLGYLFFLEHMPTSQGSSAMDALRAIGVPDTAMRFLQDHTTIDMGHNKMMERYANKLVHTQQDVDCVVYSMRVTGELYAKMMEQAVADAQAPTVRGWNWEELRADGLTPEEVLASKVVPLTGAV